MPSKKRMIASIAMAAMISVSAFWVRASKVADPASQPAKPAQPAQPAQQQDQEPVITKMRIQDFPAVHYFYASTETNLTQISATVQETMPKVLTALKENSVAPVGPSIFVYHGVTQDPNKPFTLEIGFPVADTAKDAGDMKVRQLEAFHCASVIYSGPISQVTQAYQQVFTEIFAAGLQPTGETREMYLYWDGPESPNNVELILVGVQ
jgi:effector-binding domain-containing protein